MADESSDPQPPSPLPSPFSPPPQTIRPRRELFEHGLLPIPKLIFTDGVLSLSPLRDKLLALRRPGTDRIDAESVSESVGVSPDHGRLVLDALAAVLPCDSDPGAGADVYDLVIFLYIQSYKRLLPRAHKDSSAVADVWPHASAFDGYLSALSPLQLVRSNSRRFMPSQADEEAHQLSYLQKHMANILALLAEGVDGEGGDSLVLTMERFEHLGLLLQFGDRGSDGIPLSQAAPFFANSDPDMPAAPVPASQVHDWLLQNITASLEHNAERSASKEHGSTSSSDLDVMMADASMSHLRVQSSNSHYGIIMQNSTGYSRGQAFVEGISKASAVKRACDIGGNSIKVLNCHDSVIYILAPLMYATVYGCSDATIFLGAVGKAVRVEHCERVQIIAAAKRICIANCRECIFYLGVNQKPLILGDNHKLQVAPYNAFYSQLEEHMVQVGVDASTNRWNEPIVLGLIDPHDSLSHPAGVSDVPAESATCLDPDQFTTFLIPNWSGAESPNDTKYNPFPLPEDYSSAQRNKHAGMVEIQQTIRDLQLEEIKKRELASAIHAQFKEWLYASGHIRQLYYLQGD